MDYFTSSINLIEIMKLFVYIKITGVLYVLQKLICSSWKKSEENSWDKELSDMAPLFLILWMTGKKLCPTLVAEEVNQYDAVFWLEVIPPFQMNQ